MTESELTQEEVWGQKLDWELYERVILYGRQAEIVEFDERPVGVLDGEVVRQPWAKLQYRGSLHDEYLPLRWIEDDVEYRSANETEVERYYREHYRDDVEPGPGAQFMKRCIAKFMGVFESFKRG